MSPASILLAAALLCAPGAALSLVVIPPERSVLASQVALIVPFGFVFVGLASFGLTLLHVLTLGSFLAAYLLGAAALWTVAWRRRRSWGTRAKRTRGRTASADSCPLWPHGSLRARVSFPFSRVSSKRAIR